MMHVGLHMSFWHCKREIPGNDYPLAATYITFFVAIKSNSLHGGKRESGHSLNQSVAARNAMIVNVTCKNSILVSGSYVE